MPSAVTVRVGSHTLDATPSLTHTGSPQVPSDQRRVKIPNRPSTRPCQHTCRLPSGWANTSWLNEGPSVVLTSCGSLQEPPENRQAQTTTRASTDRPNSSQGVPSAVTAAVGRNRSSGPSTSTTVVVRPSTAATSRSPRPSCHSSQPTSVVAPDVATLGRAALRLPDSTAAVPRACPTSRGAASSTAAAFSSWAGNLPVALVHPHVPQGIRLQRGDGAGDVDAVLDRGGQPVVEREHQGEVGPLLFGVLAAVMIGGAAMSVPVLGMRALIRPAGSRCRRRLPRAATVRRRSS